MPVRRYQTLIPMVQARLGGSEAEARAILEAVLGVLAEAEAERRPGVQVITLSDQGVVLRRPRTWRHKRRPRNGYGRRYNPTVPKVCVTCGRRFLAQRKTAMYCGEWCCIRAWMARKGLKVSKRHYVPVNPPG